MPNFEAGISHDQAGLLTGSIDYLANSSATKERITPDGILHQRVETESGIDISWLQTPVNGIIASGWYFGCLVLRLEEEDSHTDIQTEIEFGVNDEGVVCTAKEVLQPETGGYTDRTIKRSNLDETVRKMSKLLNQVYS